MKQAGGKRSTPKPMIDNPNASATKSTNIIKPLALKPQASTTEGEEELIQPVTPSTQISLDTLFKQVGASDGQNQSGQATVQTAQPLASTQMPPLLQRIMSHPGSYLEEIERSQRSEILRDDMPKPAGAEAPPHLNNGAAVPKMPSPPKTVQAVWTDVEPDSPNTALRRSLNIFPDSPPKKDKEGAPGGPNCGFPGLRREGVGSSRASKVENVYTISKIHVDTTSAPTATDSITGPRISTTLSQRGQTPPIQQQQAKTSRIQSLSKHVFPIQLPDTSVPPPQLPPAPPTSSSLGASQQMVGGINPLQDTSLHSQIQSLTLTDSQGHRSNEEMGSVGVTSCVRTQAATKEMVGVKLRENSHLTGAGELGGEQDWHIPGSPTKKMGLVTPQALIGGQSAPGVNKSLGSVSSQVSSSPLQTPGSMLLTPMAFETARLTPPGSGLQHQLPVSAPGEGDSTSQKSVSPVMLDFQHHESPAVNPLTKEQLQQALIHLLKNDGSFLTNIHEAYVKSLQLSLRNDRA